MTARDAWAQVAHNLRVLADSIDSAIEPASREAVPASVPAGAAAAGGGVTPAPPSAPYAPPPVCPEHGPDKRRPGKKGGFYCSFNKGTREEPDWCSWRVSA